MLFSAISSEPLIILVVLFDPLIIISGVFVPHMPGTVIMSIYAQISVGSFDALLIQSIGAIVSPFVAALGGMMMDLLIPLVVFSVTCRM